MFFRPEMWDFLSACEVYMGHSTLVVVHRVTANIFKLLCLMLDAHVSEHPNRELAGPGYQELR